MLPGSDSSWIRFLEPVPPALFPAPLKMLRLSLLWGLFPSLHAIHSRAIVTNNAQLTLEKVFSR